MNDYGIKNWSGDHFIIKNGKVCVNHLSTPSLLEITNAVRVEGYQGPLLLRFPHLLENQIDHLFTTFKTTIKEFGYKGKFRAVFPLKVNQYPTFLNEIISIGEKYHYGLEAGSKAELIVAIAYNKEGSPITVNGFKDRDMITLGFIAKQVGHDITLTIEGLGELDSIVEKFKVTKMACPNIGIRIRLHTSGMGIWGKSGGINSKFGLTSTEVVRAVDVLRKADLLKNFTMIHFHIGSQLEEIGPLKKALREAGNIYAELRKMGAENLNAINLGGGLAVEYSQNENDKDTSYSLKEVANDVVYLLKTISENKGVREPDIYTESGRFIASNHAVLVAPVLELFSQEYNDGYLRLKESGKNPPLVEELNDLYKNINKENAAEYLHDSLDHMESLLTLFDLGYIDLQDRSNTEVLVHLIIKKSLILTRGHLSIKDKIQTKIQERYLINFSIFQSIPDNWGLGQHFPVMPLDRLNETPTRSASLWDITCDSDGEISFKEEKPLFLHDVNLDERNYFLGFFLVGAYQEALAMKHNLFSRPTEAVVDIDKNGYKIKKLIPGPSLLEILEDLDYPIEDLQDKLTDLVIESKHCNENTKKVLLGEIYTLLRENGYLKTNKIV